MHHPESAGDSAGTRKMAHPAIFTRRGSNTGTSGVSPLTTLASTTISNNLVPTDDYQSPVVMQPPPPAGSSSPGPQHPPHSLNLLSQSQMQPQALPPTGAQIKKKSGFQITSVTPAQISVSTNNSIAEDTESYDDLDESHTEDLSSSEILDVSLSRATDMGGPERSSSEETLSNLHDAETPGTVSPNQPPHPLAQPPPHSAMVNGTVHLHHPHRHHHHHHGHQQVPTPHSGAGPPPVSASGVPVGGASVPATVAGTSGALPGIAQKLPAVAGATLENACAVGGAGPVTQPLGAATGTLSAATGAKISVVNPGVGNVSMLSPGPGRTSSTSSSGGISPGPMNPNSGDALGNSSQNTAVIQQQSGAVGASIAMTTAGTSSSSSMGPTGGGQIGATVAAHPSSMPAAPGPQGLTQIQAPAAAISRFRVVKLDSSSEPFRKGRWTCTEFYEKESAAAPPPPSESVRQAAPEVVACSELESTCGSSVSTVSHYSESVGSGETGGPSAQDRGQASAPGPPQTVAQPQAQPQDIMAPLQKASVAPSGVSYPQGVQPVPVQVGYPPAQQPAAPPPANPAHLMPVTQAGGLPPNFAHHQPVIQAAAQTAAPGTTHLLPPAPGSVPYVAPSANGQMMAAGMPLSANVPTAVAQPLPQGHMQQQGPSPQMAPLTQGAVLPQMLPGNVPELAQPLTRTQQHPPEQQPPPPGTQPPAAPVVSSQVTSNVPPRLPADSRPGLTQGTLPPAQNGRAAPGHGALLPPASALYAGLPSLTATQLQDAHRLLFQHQHQSLFSLPKLAAGQNASEPGVSLGPEHGNGVHALPVSAGLFPLRSLHVDGEEDR
ncbi:hypothetical protein SKAU_G00251330 [Synaphobranchus kaupii]|uniref:TSC22 domain family protein 1 n=1 Tax=Synaphobranchus kaupii TaxID=118154 RepID=A0A9Q1IRM8_SYNKA|nr:hypothetical protein SKAU_G00251330 [Synaphobranchus kaupii]